MSDVRTLKLFSWSKSPNFGDALSKDVVEYAFGCSTVNAREDESDKLLAVGSILHVLKPGDIVWGSGIHPAGFQSFWLGGKAPSNVKVLAVRGPLTRDCILARGIDCPLVFGDPALLIPEFYRPYKLEVGSHVCVIPHFGEYEKLRNLSNKGVDIVDPRRPWREVVQHIISHKKVISTSLHGIIVAEAFGIPAVWYRSGFGEGAVKYYDYFLSTERAINATYSFDEALSSDPIPPKPSILKKLKRGLIASIESGALDRLFIPHGGPEMSLPSRCNDIHAIKLAEYMHQKKCRVFGKSEFVNVRGEDILLHPPSVGCTTVIFDISFNSGCEAQLDMKLELSSKAQDAVRFHVEVVSVGKRSCKAYVVSPGSSVLVHENLGTSQENISLTIKSEMAGPGASNAFAWAYLRDAHVWRKSQPSELLNK